MNDVIACYCKTNHSKKFDTLDTCVGCGICEKECAYDASISRR